MFSRALCFGMILAAGSAGASTLNFNGQTYADTPLFDSTVTLAPTKLGQTTSFSFYDSFCSNFASYYSANPDILGTPQDCSLLYPVLDQTAGGPWSLSVDGMSGSSIFDRVYYYTITFAPTAANMIPSNYMPPTQAFAFLQYTWLTDQTANEDESEFYIESSIAPVPLPAPVALLGMGLIGLGALRRRA